MERVNISVRLPLGDISTKILSELLVFLTLCISLVHKTYFACFAWNMFEGVRDSLLLLIFCYCAVLVFGKEPSFGPTFL